MGAPTQTGAWPVGSQALTFGSPSHMTCSSGANLAGVEARRGGWWDANKIGLCTPPIETAEGWLIIYHGVRTTGAGVIYRLGLALLDLENPTRVIRRGDEWIMSPSEEYEIVGDVGYVVFPCGQVVDEVTGEIRLYYGAADSSIGVAHGNIKEMLDWLNEEMKR